MIELRRGDKVCIAFPSTLLGPPTVDALVQANKDAERHAQEWVLLLAALGVTVLRWECNSGLNQMVVTVLFREP